MRDTVACPPAIARLVAKGTGLGPEINPEGPERCHPDQSPGVAVVNSNYQYVSINSTLAALHGRSIEEHLGRSVVDALQPSVYQLLLPAYRKIITTGIGVEDVMIEGFAGTRLKRCVVSYYPVKVDAAPLWGVQVVAADITPNISEFPEASRNCNLSPMQLRVLKLIGECKSNKEIADLLCISLPTVCTHRRAILTKANLHSTSELVRYAGLLFPRYRLSRG